MSYGIQVLTSAGTESSDSLNSYGLFYKLNCLTEEGSASVPNFDSNNGFYFARVVNALRFQKVTWNNTTKIVTWQKTGTSGGSAHSSNFHILFFRGNV